MNYFEIFNKVMLELNYRPVVLFENIFKTEHLRILENINRVNVDVCTAFNWSFLEKKTLIKLDADTSEAGQGITGQITKVYDGKNRLTFIPDHESFYHGSPPQNSYGYFNDKILFGKAAHPRELTVYYNSSQLALDAGGSAKDSMDEKEDRSIIPMPYAEQILVYGTCMKTKANPAYPKFGFWNTLYTMSLVNLRAKCSPTSEDAPTIVLNT